MLIPGQNKLAEPEIVAVPRFETLLEQFKTAAVDYIAQGDAQMAARVAETLESESEVFTKLVEAATVMLQAERRYKNEQIKQMLAWWAEGSNLDAKVADLGLARQVIDPGDPNAFPPVPAELESDERLQLRYYLAPHAPAAGSRLHYRTEVLTLSGRARVLVETPGAGEVVVRYLFEEDEWAAKVKDGQGRRTAPGEVTVRVLSREDDDGTPTPELLDAVRAHFARHDVRPETDEVIVDAAEVVPYKIRAKAYIHPGPDSVLTEEDAVARLQAYAEQQHALGGEIDPSWVYHYLHESGAVRIELLEPLEPIAAAWYQAPWCEAIELEVVTQ
jgi:phage-related baseplate assembly protein